MAIANLVQYDSTFDLELTHPLTGEEIGVLFKIRSDSSPEAKQVFRRQVDHYAQEQQRSKRVKSEKLEQYELEKKAACIAGWDWRGNDALEDGDGGLEYNKANCIEILKVDWIYNQVAAASADLANFTKR